MLGTPENPQVNVLNEARSVLAINLGGILWPNENDWDGQEWKDRLITLSPTCLLKPEIEIQHLSDKSDSSSSSLIWKYPILLWVDPDNTPFTRSPNSFLLTVNDALSLYRSHNVTLSGPVGFSATFGIQEHGFTFYEMPSEIMEIRPGGDKKMFSTEKFLYDGSALLFRVSWVNTKGAYKFTTTTPHPFVLPEHANNLFDRNGMYIPRQEPGKVDMLLYWFGAQAQAHQERQTIEDSAVYLQVEQAVSQRMSFVRGKVVQEDRKRGTVLQRMVEREYSGIWGNVQVQAKITSGYIFITVGPLMQKIAGMGDNTSSKCYIRTLIPRDASRGDYVVSDVIDLDMQKIIFYGPVPMVSTPEKVQAFLAQVKRKPVQADVYRPGREYPKRGMGRW